MACGELFLYACANPQAQAATLLGHATTRIVYDLERFKRAGQPAFAATMVRETHFSEPGGNQTRIQISFSYSDGFGREIQKKIQAEAGDAPQRQAAVPLSSGDIRPGDLLRDPQGKPLLINTAPRWVGTGRTVFNNKGKPVKQYEPFFSATHLYEGEREMTDTGVSPILFYDPVERVIATLHPNHSYQKVVFDPWQQTTYDVNDTVAAHGTQTGDPRTDPDIKGYVAEYFNTQPLTWKTWYAQRHDASDTSKGSPCNLPKAMKATTASTSVHLKRPVVVATSPHWWCASAVTGWPTLARYRQPTATTAWPAATAGRHRLRPLPTPWHVAVKSCAGVCAMPSLIRRRSGWVMRRRPAKAQRLLRAGE